MKMSSMPVLAGESPELFVYRGYRFLCSTEPMGNGFRPVVVCLNAEGGSGRKTLPDDTEQIGYATRAEAQRHAEQQAMRWVHDRTGTGQAQF